MREVKDPEIKLFGKKIALPENRKVLTVVVSSEDSGEWNSGNSSYGVTVNETNSGSECDRCIEDEKASNQKKDESDEEMQEADKHYEKQLSEATPEEKDENQMMEGSADPKLSSDSGNNTKTPTIDEDSPTLKSSKTENDQNDSTNSQQKPLKKPDKILPCPRCNSMDTKFCYYNNYNVNQPRHFCKSCQRYWTAGGTMRNVPVGAGRRKNKNAASHCRHITISEALQAARIDPPNGFHCPTFKPNGTVLSFGPDSPLCDSMASVLNLAEKKVPNGICNGFYGPEQKKALRKVGETGDDCSSGSSITTSNTMVDGGTNRPHETVVPNVNGFQSPVPCLAGVPWPYPWNGVPVPAIFPPPYPLSFFPTPYWNCNVAWTMPWLTPPSPTGNQKGSGSAPNSPLGKHSREGDLLKSNNSEEKESPERKNLESSVLVPKTLRIDDPDEAAKSSIWSTLGIKYDSVSRGGLFKALQPKSDEKDRPATTSPMLQANPAALSRSVSFQERA